MSHRPSLYTPAFIALFLANLCMVSSFTTFFLFPLFITERGGGEREIGIIMGIFAMASAGCRPWISEMIDRLGRKRCFTIGSVVMTLMPLLHLLLSGSLERFYYPLLLMRIVHGVGLAICFTAVFTFVADIIPEGRLNEGIGMFGVSGLIGMAIGPALAEPIMEKFGFSAFFLTAAALAASAFLLHLPLKVTDHPDQHLVKGAPSFFALLKQRKFMIVGGLSMVFGFGLAATGNFVAPLAQERSLRHISLYYMTYSGAAVAVRFFAGKLADRVGERQILPWGLGLAVAGLLLLPLVTGNLLLMTAGLLFGTGHGLIFPTLNAMAIRNEPYAVRGKITGIFTGGIDSGIFSGSLILGLVGEWLGLSGLFLCAGFLVLLGLWLARVSLATGETT
ncbi:MAG: MFS transporter [Desulfuromonas sp.]|nr:MAG: MFS transporter [Desulfuromonas sp.]